MDGFKIAAVTGVAAFFMTAQASAAVIFEDSFELPRVQTWQVFQTGVGDNGDWDLIDGAGIEIQRSQGPGHVQAFDGDQYVELDSDRRRGGQIDNFATNSAMAANVDFVAGQTYEISFAYRPRTSQFWNDNGINLFALEYDGVTPSNQQHLIGISESTLTLSDWTIVSVIYTAAQDINAIAFQATGITNTFGGFIDAVSVTQLTQVPVPAALPLFGAGLASLAWARRRKQKTA